MAARSPVTIESSPLYDAYQAPSITPDSLRRSVSTNPINQSSPQLLSPSTFLRPRAQPLKSGSRAQQVPAGAHAGFASAASIWKEQGKGEDARGGHGDVVEDSARQGNVQDTGRCDPATKKAGKLTKPRKIPKSRKPSVTADAGPESPRFDSFVKSKEGSSTSLAKHTEMLQAKAIELQEGAVRPRQPSINLSEYSFNADPALAPLNLPAKDDTTTEKTVRKCASKTTKNSEASATKKFRKSKAKSAAIILDSDEPEEALVEADAVDTSKSTFASATVAKKPRPRKQKQSAVNKTTSSSTTDVVAIPAQVTKSKEAADNFDEAPAEKSAYFGQDAATVAHERLPSSPPPVVFSEVVPTEVNVAAIPDETIAADLVADNSLPPTEPAPRRRRSWTPAKDSLSENATNTLSIINQGPDENMDQIPFSELLGNFSYLQSEAGTVPRAANGEASTKRRRIALSEQVVMPQLQTLDTPKAKAAPKAAKTAKKPKAIPKKPQTVTALALAAYQPSKDHDPVQSTVSTYFAPQEEIESLPPARPVAEGEEVVVKVKKPRKSRAKAPPADGEVAPAKKATKSRTKTSKVKVKFDKDNHQAPLCSPTQACKQIKSQDFVFGTSSQLATDESPEFVRDMQLAIQQSEITCAMPNSSQIGTQLDLSAMDEEKSCARVPTAPHGTCLSVEQAGRELWCISARDSTGSKLAHEHSLPLPMELSAADEEPIVRVIDVITLSSYGREGRDFRGPDSQKFLDAEVRPASPNPEKPVQASQDIELPAHTSLEVVGHGAQVDLVPDKPPPGDEWVFLGSDDSALLPKATISKPQERSHDSATSPVRRTALQPLDANISMIAPDSTKTSGKLQAHPFSTSATPLERGSLRMQPSTIDLDSDPAMALPPKRGRGRPRKDASLERPVQTSPTRALARTKKNSLVENAVRTSPVRGRPRKEDTVVQISSSSPPRPEAQPHKVNVVDRVPATLPKRSVGLPRPEPATTTLSPRAFRRVRSPLHPSASQPISRHEWTRIDEISDSDSPATPSPRRRRASSPAFPAFVRPLDFEAPQSPSVVPKIAVSATNAAIKATDAGWPAIQTSMFPQIAETIKAAPVSEDMNAPSWYEKILLYDPIVLEDLTAWLNAQGLRFEMERLKPKTKTKGRKKKDAPPEVDEWEAVEYELKPWMVQKWCEENSVCCLWREGLRGGVKARY